MRKKWASGKSPFAASVVLKELHVIKPLSLAEATVSPSGENATEEITSRFDRQAGIGFGPEWGRGS
jgi:hypothetical protein